MSTRQTILIAILFSLPPPARADTLICHDDGDTPPKYCYAVAETDPIKIEVASYLRNLRMGVSPRLVLPLLASATRKINPQKTLCEVVREIGLTNCDEIARAVIRSYARAAEHWHITAQQDPTAFESPQALADRVGASIESLIEALTFLYSHYAPRPAIEAPPAPRTTSMKAA